MIDVQKLKKKITNELLEKFKSDISKKSYIYPSEISDCSRAIWYKLKHFPIDPAYKLYYPELRLLGDLGNCFHDHFQTEASEFVVSEQNFMLEDLLVKGRIDAMSSGQETLYEIKTADTKTYLALKLPIHKHLLQILVYTIAFPKVKDICLIYVNRNFKKYDLDIKQFEYKNIQADVKLLELVSFIRTKINYIREYYLTSKAPTEFLVKDSCFFCPFKHICDQKEIKKR